MQATNTRKVLSRRLGSDCRRAISVAVVLAAATLLVSSANAEGLPANELGQVMILAYHRIDYPERRWTRTPEQFRTDLELLYARGYRLIGLRDLVAGHINIPAGMTPIVLTFDDSSPGQFRYIKTPTGPRLDPKCAVAILEAFVQVHPDFGHAATFFVLPAARRPNRLFDQPEYEAMKLQELVRRGFEIGNHTLWHANLAMYGERVVRHQIAEAQRAIQRLVPEYSIRSLALPYGAYPPRVEWVINGTENATTYHHDAVLMISGGPALSPFSRDFNPTHLPRIQAIASELRRWLEEFDRTPHRRFVSDGNADMITIPPGSRSRLRDALRPPLGIRDDKGVSGGNR